MLTGHGQARDHEQDHGESLTLETFPPPLRINAVVVVVAVVNEATANRLMLARGCYPSSLNTRLSRHNRRRC